MKKCLEAQVYIGELTPSLMTINSSKALGLGSGALNSDAADNAEAGASKVPAHFKLHM